MAGRSQIPVPGMADICQADTHRAKCVRELTESVRGMPHSASDGMRSHSCGLLYLQTFSEETRAVA
jgi:hypothetical protein